jgi:ankyrin repeat protein
MGLDANETGPIAGHTTLSLAVQHKYASAVEILVEVDDINIRTRDTEFNWTPLQWAVQRNDLKIMELLLRHESIMTKDITGALFTAVHNNCIGAFSVLMTQKDVDLNAKSEIDENATYEDCRYAP